MSDLVAELVRSSPWSHRTAEHVVMVCEARGLSEKQTRDFCRLALSSGLPVGWWLEALKP